MNKVAVAFLCLLFFTACNNEEGEASNSEASNSGDTSKVIAQVVARLRIAIFDNDTLKSGKPIKGFGYNIYKDDALYIHQPAIPAVPGNEGFSTEAKAKKAAEFVAYKIRNNIMPPSVTPQELDSLGVLK